MSIGSEFDRIREKRRAELNTTPSQTPGGPVRYFDSLLNNTYEFPAGTTPDAIRAAVAPIHERARASASLFSGVPQGFVRQDMWNAAKGVGSYMSDMAGAAGRALGMLGQTKVQAPRILQQLTTPPQGPQAPAQLPVTPATVPAVAANLPANPYIDQNYAAMMQAPGIVPRAPVSPMDQNYAAMMPSQGAIPQQAPMQGQGMGAPQGPYPFMDAGALNQIGTILQMADPVPRFPKVDRATAAALGNNFQPYMQARRADIQAQQQDQRTKKENALREKALFMQQQRQEQERRDRLAYQQMLMENNEREEQLALKRFQMEADRAAREEQRFQEEQRQNAMPQWKVYTGMGMAYALDPATGQVMVKPIPEMQAAMARRAAGSGGGGAGGGEGGLSSAEMSLMMREGATPDLIRALASGAPLTPEHMAELDTLRWNKTESARQAGWGNVYDSLVKDLGEDAARAEADRRFPQGTKPPSVAALQRGREFDSNVAARTGNPLSGEAARSARTDAPPEKVAEFVALGLMSEADAVAALLPRGLKLPGK